MGTEGFEYFRYQPQQKTAFKRSVLIIVCTVILCLSGSFTLILTTPRAAARQDKPPLAHNTRVIATADIHQQIISSTPTGIPSPVATATPSPEATPTPSPVATPTSSSATAQKPIEPFPPYLAQEVALLQSKERLFYYGNRAIPEIALTFDDGPNPPYTDQILAILQHYGVHATFFCVGRLVQAYPTLVKQEFTQGNLIENHTWAHPYLPYLSGPSIIWQLTTTADAIESVTGVRPTFFRPPYGAFNSTVLTYANQFGLTTFLWDVDPRDWSLPGVNVIVARVRAQTQNGSIILMHDGGGNRSQTVAALPTIIEWYQQHGFHFVTLQQLVDDFNQKVPSSTPVTAILPSSSTSVETVLLPSQLEAWKRRTGVV